MDRDRIPDLKADSEDDDDDDEKDRVPPRKLGFNNNVELPRVELKYKSDESDTCKVIDNNCTAIRMYWLSNLLPEATMFKVSEMPAIQSERGVMRILVLAGSISHFSGDILEVLFEHWVRQYDHILFLFGPYDVGMGTVSMGEVFCRKLQSKVGEEKLSIFQPGYLDSVLFTGPGVRFVGAPCWPANDEFIYKEAAVYEEERVENDAAESVYYKACMNAVDKKRYLTLKTAAHLLKGDVATIIAALHGAIYKRIRETRIVVTYGCPDTQLSIGVKEGHPFRGDITMGSRNMYAFLEKNVDYWIYGAKGDNPRSRMGPIITLSQPCPDFRIF